MTRDLTQAQFEAARMIQRRGDPRRDDGPDTGTCDTCGHKNGHRAPGGSMICEPCFYTYDPEADYTYGG